MMTSMPTSISASISASISDIHLQKQNLRQYLHRLRDGISSVNRELFSQQILTSLRRQLALLEQQPLQLMLYSPLPHEVDTRSLFSSSEHELFVPRMLADMGLQWMNVNASTQWEKAAFGVVEPVAGKLWQADAAKKTVLLCPLLGFDRQGNRLGMGKGYFDRWLAEHGKDILMQIGLAFSCQELVKVPTEPHDAALSMIITEKEVIACPTH